MPNVATSRLPKKRIYIVRSARLVSIAVALLMTAGCVVEGTFDSTYPYMYKSFVRYTGIDSELRDRHADLLQNSRAEREGLIVIGNVTVLREFTEKNSVREYQDYKRAYRVYSKKEVPTLGESEFGSTIAGWTMLALWDIPLVSSLFIQTLVPAAIVDEVKFENPFSTAFARTSGDLVAAESNQDGALEIKAVLCIDGDKYDECASQFKLAVYDLATGLELSLSLKPKINSGEMIDTSTYRVILERDSLRPAECRANRNC